ncbi:MAG: transcriptional regulator [Devosia sp.]
MSRRLIVKLRTDEQAWNEIRAAAGAIDRGEGYQGETLGFSTWTQLFAVFSPKRWELLQTLQQVGPSSVRGLARALGRDVKRVHEDVTFLLDEEIIERDEAGKVLVPYESIRIDGEMLLTSPRIAAE